MNNWSLEYIVVLTCGISLLGVVSALIFSRSFRQDLIAQPGKLSIFGISVEGVVIVLLVGLMIGAMLYASNRYSSMPSIALADLPISVTDANDARQKINQLVAAVKEQQALDIVRLVRNLKYEQPESAEIRSFQHELVGPWAVGDKAEQLFMTVPDDINPNEVRACPRYKGKKFEIRSRLADDDGTSGQRVEVEVTAAITLAKDCEKNFNFIQVSCEIAQKVFSGRVVSCDENNQPLWKLGRKKLPIWLTQISP